MSSTEVCARIRADAQFAQLVRRRQSLAWLLSSIVLVCHFGFILVVGFVPQLLGTPMSASSPVSIGLPLGALLILFFWILTGVYIHRANRDFDSMTAEIVKRAAQ